MSFLPANEQTRVLHHHDIRAPMPIAEEMEPAGQAGAGDQTIIRTAPEAYAVFLERLNAPPQPNERLRKTMQTKLLWDQA